MGETYTYEMVTAHERAIRIQAAEEREMKAGMTKKDLQRARKKRQENDPHLRLLAKKMEEEEERFDPVYHSSLANCAYFP